jgi:hypothetical protein
MTDINVNEVRRRCWHYLSPEVAAHAGLTWQELQRFVSGSFAATLGGSGLELSQPQLLALARRVGCCDND